VEQWNEEGARQNHLRRYRGNRGDWNGKKKEGVQKDGAQVIANGKKIRISEGKDLVKCIK